MDCLFPRKITAGTTLDHLITSTAYPASAGWSLRVHLVGAENYTLTSVAEGNQHRIGVAATLTANYVPGEYFYSIRAERDGEKIELDHGSIRIFADLATAAAGTDFRSHAARTLSALEAVIEGRATLDQERYRINNRELYRTPIETLYKLRNQYRREVSAEQAKACGKSPFSTVIRVKLQ